MNRIRNASDLASWRLCVGCGACAYVCPENAVRLTNFFPEGIRPVVQSVDCGGCQDCVRVCPMVQSDFGALNGADEAGSNFVAMQNDWGRILEIWEGHATDESIRFAGSSGGVLTALSA